MKFNPDCVDCVRERRQKRSKKALRDVLKAALAHVNREMQPCGGNTLTQCRRMAKELRQAKAALAESSHD